MLAILTFLFQMKHFLKNLSVATKDFHLIKMFKKS